MPLHTGSVKYAATDTTPGDTQGNSYYDLSEKALKHYDGTTWAKVDTRNENLDRPGDGHYTSDSYTSLLIKSDTTNNSTVFNDSGNSTHTLTAVGNVKHDTGAAKIGTTSILFNNTGSVSDYLTIPNSADWNFGTGDFTIDAWVRPISHGYQGHGSIIAFTNIGNTGNSIKNWRFNGTNGFFLEGSTDYQMANNLSHNVWAHIAVTRAGTTLRFFKDGVLDSTHTGNSINYQSLGIGIHIGNSWMGYASHSWYGYIDEFRISKGIARWTSAFTVY